MKISIGADHGASALREAIVHFLKSGGYDVMDHGSHQKESVDYPDFAKVVANDVASGRADFGVLCCTSGIGMSIAANKVRGVRAALIHSIDDAFYARRHNDANVICFGQRHHTTYDAERYLECFLKTPFEGGRHHRRVAKLEGEPAEDVPSC